MERDRPTRQSPFRNKFCLARVNSPLPRNRPGDEGGGGRPIAEGAVPRIRPGHAICRYFGIGLAATIAGVAAGRGRDPSAKAKSKGPKGSSVEKQHRRKVRAARDMVTRAHIRTSPGRRTAIVVGEAGLPGGLGPGRGATPALRPEKGTQHWNRTNLKKLPFVTHLHSDHTARVSGLNPHARGLWAGAELDVLMGRKGWRKLTKHVLEAWGRDIENSHHRDWEQAPCLGGCGAPT